MKRTKQQRPVPQGRRRKSRRKKKARWSAYTRLVVVLLIAGTVFLSIKLYELWEIRQDMQITIRQEQELTEENQRLHNQKDLLESPAEIMRQAREQFGMARHGEIPYRP